MACPPKFIQAVLLFDEHRPFDLNALVTQVRAEADVPYQLVFDTRPSLYYRLTGGNLMVTIEHIEGRADVAKFETALSSPFVQRVSADARERIARHRSHVLVGVHEGVFTPGAEMEALLSKLNMTSMLGGSPGGFRRCLATCGGIAKLAHAIGGASLVHWTATDHLMPGDAFATLAAEPAPSLLHIHPLIYDGGLGADGRRQVAIKTFGAAHFIDREIHVAASPLDFPEVWPMIACFLNVATAAKGYVLPHGDTFCDAAESFNCRVNHVPAEAMSGPFEGPLYRLDPLMSRTSGFMAPDHIEGGFTFDDRTIPRALIDENGGDHSTIRAELRAKRDMAEGLGGSLRVKRKQWFGGSPPPRPFGRRSTAPEG